MTIRGLVCNHVQLYAEGLRGLLNEDGEILLVGLAVEDRDLENLEDLDPDVVITDSAFFPKVAGRVKRILLIWDGQGRKHIPHIDDLKMMVIQGLAGIVDARTDSALLRKAVTKVNAGDFWIDHQFIRNSLFMDGIGTNIHLSRREADILRHICEGNSNKEIAEKLCISVQTVKTHCNKLFKKFGVSSRLQLALLASSND